MTYLFACERCGHIDNSDYCHNCGLHVGMTKIRLAHYHRLSLDQSVSVEEYTPRPRDKRVKHAQLIITWH